MTRVAPTHTQVVPYLRNAWISARNWISAMLSGNSRNGWGIALKKKRAKKRNCSDSCGVQISAKSPMVDRQTWVCCWGFTEHRIQWAWGLIKAVWRFCSRIAHCAATFTFLYIGTWWQRTFSKCTTWDVVWRFLIQTKIIKDINVMFSKLA